MNDKQMRRLRRLAFVPRWNAIPTQRRQSVLEHTASIMPIALWLCQFHRTVDEVKDRGEILWYCLMHDESEAISGDIPAPFKHIPTMQHAVNQWEINKGLGTETRKDVKYLVKVADCLDALMFLREESEMGNSTVVPVITDVKNNMGAAWENFEWAMPDNKNKFSVDRLVDFLWVVIDINNHPLLEADAL